MGDRRPSGATSSASIPTRPSATLPYGPPSSTACRPSSSRATRRWSAIPATSASSPPRAAVTSRSIRLGSARMPASTASMCWPPIPSFPPCRWRWPIASCGKWNRSSERQRRSWRRGRSIISATPLSSATCFAPSSRWCCARHSTNGSRPPAPSWNGATSSATSTGSRRSLSIREPSASCYAPSHQAMPGSSARLSASPCRPWYARSRRLGRRHSPAHPRRAADGPAVVPRGPDFPELSHQINKFAIRGVKISHDGRAIESLFVRLFLEAYKTPPREIVLDLDATDDPLHGHQEGRFFHGYYDCYCYLPLYIFCDRHLLAAKLRPANIDAAAGVVEEVARITGEIRAWWPDVRIIVRADSGFAREALMAWCEGNGVDFIIGLAKNARLVRAIGAELLAAKEESQETGQPARRFTDLFWSTRKSWSRRRRVIGKAEWTQAEANPRFVVTSLSAADGDAKQLYEQLYCA